MSMESRIKKETGKGGGRLWLANEAMIKLSLGKIEISGKENLKKIPPGAKVVILTSHLTDLDMPIAIHSIGGPDGLDLAVTNQSIHHKFFGSQGEAATNLGLRIAGKENFIPIGYRRNESGKKSPTPFNQEDFKPAVEAMEKGKAVLVAAHNPSPEPLQSLKGIKGGHGGVYLAELADAYIIPITSVLDQKVGMHEDKMKTLKTKPNASVVIGEPFKLEKIEDIEKLGESREGFSKLADALREKSRQVMDKLSEQIERQTGQN